MNEEKQRNLGGLGILGAIVLSLAFVILILVWIGMNIYDGIH